MNTKLSQRHAHIYAAIIGIFYLVSGFWEYLLGLAQLESTPSGKYFLLDIYRSYMVILGLVTIVVGFLLLCRINFARLAALALAWWNLFTAPLLDIWWSVYVTVIKKFLLPHSWFELGIKTAILILIILIRLYIIRMLKVSKAGYIFLRKDRYEDANSRLLTKQN